MRSVYVHPSLDGALSADVIMEVCKCLPLYPVNDLKTIPRRSAVLKAASMKKGAL